MRVLLDGSEIQSAEPTLAGAIDAGRTAAEAAGRAIIEVAIDGRPVVGDQLESPSAEPLDAREVALTSTDPVSLVRTTLLDAAEALESSRPEHAVIAEALQAGDSSDALTRLSATLQVWQAAQDVLTRGWMLLGRDPGSLDVPEGAEAESVQHMVGALAEQLREIKRALGDQDLAAVADVVGYELAPMSEHWVALLRRASELA
ncbi:MAG: hypothetical protein AAF937_07460 [Planctomycetota bacterium]